MNGQSLGTSYQPSYSDFWTVTSTTINSEDIDTIIATNVNYKYYEYKTIGTTYGGKTLTQYYVLTICG